MFDRLNNRMFSIFILLIYISTSVYSDSCASYERRCFDDSHSYSWCCPRSATCGSDYESCYYSTTTPPPTTTTPDPSFFSDLPTILIVVIIVVLSVFFVSCICCCIRMQRQQQSERSPLIVTNSQLAQLPYQQQSVSGPIRVVRVRSVYNMRVTPQAPSIYEAEPPSYESATANLPPHYQSSSPSIATTNEQTNLRV